MQRSVASAVVLGAVVVGWAAVGPRQDNQVMAAVVREVELLDALRSSLAGTFGAQGVPADRNTFQTVCRPVGMRAQELAREHGWRVQQLAERNRNPGNTLDTGARRAYRLLDEDAGLMGLWEQTEMNGRPGLRYFRRIVVEPACLACHGERDARPAFVREGYPADRAFGFQVGDLRGVYSVFVPTD